jgi:hypothetical protein
LRSGNLAGNSIFPLRETTRAGNISLRTLIAIPTVWVQTVRFQQDGATETIFRKGILQLKCSEIKLTLAINSLKKIVHFSFYSNLKIVRYFCRTLYIYCTRSPCWSWFAPTSSPRHKMTLKGYGG